MRGIEKLIIMMTMVCSPSLCLRGAAESVSSAKDASGARTAKTDAASDAVKTALGIADRLDALEDYSTVADFTVSLAMTDQDVDYRLRMAETRQPQDTLFGADYLIDWQLRSDQRESRGFTAYFDGHCYRYRDRRLQEYHFQWDSIPFLTAAGGVQRNGQFVDLLPRSISRQLKQIADNPKEYTIDVSHSGSDADRTTTLRIRQEINGAVGRNFTLTINDVNSLPVKVVNEYNPAQISEQTVVVEYSYPTDDQALKAVSTEEDLIAMYPADFVKFRESNYRVENLRGQPLPTFGLPTLTGELYHHTKGDGFRSPTLVAILNPDNAAAATSIKALRRAQATMPRSVDLIFAFTTSNADLISEAVGQPIEGEYDLLKAKVLARDCGTSVFPTILVVNSDGIITDVILGVNNSLVQDVIQSVALIE